MIDRDRRIKILEDRNRELEKQVSYYEGYIACIKDIVIDDEIIPVEFDMEVEKLDDKYLKGKI